MCLLCLCDREKKKARQASTPSLTIAENDLLRGKQSRAAITYASTNSINKHTNVREAVNANVADTAASQQATEQRMSARTDVYETHNCVFTICRKLVKRMAILGHSEFTYVREQWLIT